MRHALYALALAASLLAAAGCGKTECQKYADMEWKCGDYPAKEEDITRQMADLRKAGAPAAQIDALKKARAAAIAAHKDEAGHIFNIETNFGLTAAYLTYLRRQRLSEVTAEDIGWYTAVAAYNQGVGPANDLIYKVYAGPADYNARAAAEIFSAPTAARLSLSHERQEEMLGEVGMVMRCAGR